MRSLISAVKMFFAGLRGGGSSADKKIEEGRANITLGKNEEAIADLTEAIRLNPEEAFAYHNRGVAYGKLEKYEEAIADYTEAIRLNPEFAEAYNNPRITGATHMSLTVYVELVESCLSRPAVKHER